MLCAALVAGFKGRCLDSVIGCRWELVNVDESCGRQDRFAGQVLRGNRMGFSERRPCRVFMDVGWGRW